MSAMQQHLRSMVMRAGMSSGPVFDADAAVYLAAVETADGQALEPAVKAAINDFVVGCKSDGIWDAIKASCILAGARTLNGALVPLKGAAPTNVGGLFVAGDYNRETGLAGNRSTKYLDTNRNDLEDPEQDLHYSVYRTASGTPSVNTDHIATQAISTLFSRFATSAAGAANFSNRRSSPVIGFVGAGPTLGFAGSSRVGSGCSARIGGTTSTASIASAVATNSNWFVFARNGSPPSAYSDSRIAFYSVGESIDLEKLDTRVTALVAAIGEAI